MMNILRFHDRTLIVADESLTRTLELALRASRVSAPVLICGESGTGKELVARFIHERSSRSSGPFVSVNCAAIPEGLMEAELFGYERGAFTGATARRLGKFEQASRGTLLLDEISEMGTSLQTKLLRVIQEEEIDRLGGSRPIPIDSRIIATTNRDPRLLMREGSFREDLFYRLNVIRIDCVPLRGRPEAILRLAEEFLRESAISQGRGEIRIGPSARKSLIEHDWPGNIRELQNAMERAVLLCDELELQPEHFELCHEDTTVMRTSEEALSDIERRHILGVVGKTSGNRSEAAKKLGISIRTLRNKLKEYSS